MKTFKPQIYAKYLYKRYPFAQLALEKVSDRLQWRGGERVLDIGCGTGDITRRCILPLLPNDFKSLMLSDVSKEMLELAKSEFYGLKRVNFLQLDIGKNLDDNLKGSFDRIFSVLCFMYVANQRKAFENAFQLLAPGGDCFIHLVTTGALLETTFQLMDAPKWKDKLKRCREVMVFPYREDPKPEKTIEELLKSVGFSDVLVKKGDFPQSYTDENFRDIMKCLPEFPNDMTDKEKQDLLDEQLKLATSFNIIEDVLDKSKPVGAFEYLMIYGKRS